MSTFLFDKIIFGPVHSRRLGKSLGINLLPLHSKICTYNCIYCECGWSSGATTEVLPSAADVRAALEAYLQHPDKHPVPDTITFAGNGEPTLHNQFAQIIADTVELRNKYVPTTKIAVLTNATRLQHDDVVNALKIIELPILKLDTVLQSDFEFLNRCRFPLQIGSIVEAIGSHFSHPIIQTMFLRADTDDFHFDNTAESSLQPYLHVLQQLDPQLVMLYSISRDTPMLNLVKIDEATLNRISLRINKLGIKTLVTP